MSRTLRVICASAIVFLFCISTPASGQTIHVPDDFATIQAALDAADDLYTIIVRDGVYTGDGNNGLDFGGKALTLRSENGPENCIIDSGGAPWGFYFHSGETSAALVDGFTVTNGSEGGIYCFESSPTIANCVIRDNNGYYARSGIYCHAASPTITGCVISGNTSMDNWDGGGAGIYCNYGSSVTISNCVITDNTADFAGFEGNGAGIFCGNQSTVTITGSTISGNSTDSGLGGGIYCVYGSSLNISDCVISDNSASLGGGINFDISWGGSVSISNCVITGNVASEGGGIFGGGGLATISDCTISDNSAYYYGGGLCVAEAITVENCVITGNSAESDAGGIFIDGGSPRIVNCVIAGNSTDGSGGGIYSRSTAPTITHCTISGNRAEDIGGGVYGYGSDLTLTDCILWGNAAPNGPEAALITALHTGSPSSLTISYSAVQGGQAAVLVEPDSVVNWGAGNIEGDPLFVDPGYWDRYTWNDGDYHLTYGSPCKDAGTDAGVIDDIDGDTRPSGPAVDMGADEFVFVANNCPSLSGENLQPATGDTRTAFGFSAHYYDEDGNAPTVANVVVGGVPYQMTLASGSASDGDYSCSVRLGAGDHSYYFSFYDGSGCLARLPSVGSFEGPQVAGATVYVPDDYTTIQAALDDSLVGDTIIVRDGVYTGEGNKELDFLGKPITLRSENGPANCIIDSEGDGRGFYFRNRESAESVLDGFTITNGYVTGSWWYTPGGGILCKNRSTPTIKNCLITNNSAEYGGGLSFTDKASPILLNCTISNNSASRSGGGIYGNPGDHDVAWNITDCTISGNDAGSGGGMLLANGVFSITNSAITGNSAYGDGGAMLTHSDVHITDSEISGNSADDNGGAIFFMGTTSTLTNCSITGNSAGIDGGAIYGNNAGPILTNCVITGNSAVGNGGAIQIWGNQRDPILTNCLLAENSAGQEGGAFSAVDRLSVFFSNCTFSGNSASTGGALCGDVDSALTIVDSIFAGDVASSGPEIALLSGSSAHISYSDVLGGIGAVYREGGSIDKGEGNIDADPLFAVGPLGDYYLSQTIAGQGATSPCVNRGSDTAANLGLIAYTTRTNEVGDGGQVDMGYHYPGIPASDLTELYCAAPANESILYSAPTFGWTTDGGANSAYIVDMSFSVYGPFYPSPVIFGDAGWTMPDNLWNMIPSGSYVYWRMRGADLDVRPLSIIYSSELWWFYKP